MSIQDEKIAFQTKFVEAYVDKFYDGDVEKMVNDVAESCRKFGQDVRSSIVKHRAPFCMDILLARQSSPFDSQVIQGIIDKYSG